MLNTFFPPRGKNKKVSAGNVELHQVLNSPENKVSSLNSVTVTFLLMLTTKQGAIQVNEQNSSFSLKNMSLGQDRTIKTFT